MTVDLHKRYIMKAIELIGDIDEQHRLHAQVPTEVPAGQVRLIVFLPGEDDAGSLWADGIVGVVGGTFRSSGGYLHALRRPASE